MILSVNNIKKFFYKNFFFLLFGNIFLLEFILIIMGCFHLLVHFWRFFKVRIQEVINIQEEE
jgi:hypothetical protein